WTAGTSEPGGHNSTVTLPCSFYIFVKLIDDICICNSGFHCGARRRSYDGGGMDNPDNQLILFVISRKAEQRTLKKKKKKNTKKDTGDDMEELRIVENGNKKDRI
ncbi:hypothetical protein XENOCAPTIV_023545, partial [Xenoophorus captivus]